MKILIFTPGPSAEWLDSATQARLATELSDSGVKVSMTDALVSEADWDAILFASDASHLRGSVLEGSSWLPRTLVFGLYGDLCSVCEELGPLAAIDIASVHAWRRGRWNDTSMAIRRDLATSLNLPIVDFLSSGRYALVSHVDEYLPSMVMRCVGADLAARLP